MATKREQYSILYALVDSTDKLTPDKKLDLLSFIDHQVEMLEKKAENGKKVVTSTQKANEVLKAEMLEEMELNRPYRANQFVLMDRFRDRGYSLNKFSAMLKQLKESGLIISQTVRKVTTFIKVGDNINDIETDEDIAIEENDVADIE